MSNIIERVDGEVVEVDTWDQMAAEPDKWFVIFQKYFLPLGPGRSVRQAYKVWQEDHGKTQGPKDRPTRWWLQMANRWEWRLRAFDYDKHLNQRTMNVAELAIDMLQDVAVDAVEALASALDNPRTRVAAAKEILDRAGVPALKRTEKVSVTLTGEDIRRAKDDADEWEKKQFPSQTNS